MKWSPRGSFSALPRCPCFDRIHVWCLRKIRCHGSVDCQFNQGSCSFLEMFIWKTCLYSNTWALLNILHFVFFHTVFSNFSYCLYNFLLCHDDTVKSVGQDLCVASCVTEQADDFAKTFSFSQCPSLNKGVSYCKAQRRSSNEYVCTCVHDGEGGGAQRGARCPPLGRVALLKKSSLATPHPR